MSHANNNVDFSADQLVDAKSKPDVNNLCFEFQRALYTGNNVTRVDANDETRFCKWNGQTDDGKKWSSNKVGGDQVFPFEGASDVRIRLVDATINEIVSVLTTSFSRGNLAISGVDIQDGGSAALATDLMTWIRENKLKAELEREAELLAQYTQQYGWRENFDTFSFGNNRIAICKRTFNNPGHLS